MSSVGEWLEANADRETATRQIEADAAKLVATFATGVAAALVASAMETQSASDWTVRSAWLLGASALLAIAVALVDRRTTVNVTYVLQQSTVQGWTDDQTLRELRLQNIAAAEINRATLTTVRITLALHLAVTVASGAFAGIALV